MKEFTLGIIALCGIILGILVVGLMTILLLYGFGWTLGWAMNYFVGPTILGGIAFPQIMALMMVFSGLIAGAIAPVAINVKLVESTIAATITEKFKEYRGY